MNSYDIAVMWVYTNEGRKVGEYEIVDITEETLEEEYEAAFLEYCFESGLNPAQHNQCLGRIEVVKEAVTG